MSGYSRILRAVGDRRWFATVASRVAPILDRAVYRISGGRRLATPNTVPTFFLTSVGRLSGAERRVAVSYLEDDGAFLVVGTNWGKTTSPDWALNLLANPRAWIETRGERIDVVARPVAEGEHDGLWHRFTEMWPAYGAYRRRAEHRTIHMFRLIPAVAGAENLS